ncbi:thermonuclease family protein [Desulfohalobiaceae bacterium Ax17]|uniref:thermonuclease family protein n=1 Tax=Desulfovulcanus ferrireducens TaxID=2831190 RepID=UPI00207BA901|nr:thermonuclease family protein [Desulfovulcanus ferrireducens]MBT8764093.1 thermonuclease family protein [Desulfovulcanus ferrireducens]
MSTGQSRIFRCIFLGCLLVAFLLSAFSVHAVDWQVRVKRVLDGDTLILESGEKVRLQGIDAPEIGHGGAPSQYFAREAKRELLRLVQGQTLIIKTEEISVDRYGRILAHVYLPTKESLNYLLVEKGLAFCFFYKGQNEHKFPHLLAAQRRAMDARQGFWARILTMDAARKAYLGNKRSKRFHRLSCDFGQRVSSKNKILFSSLKEAFYAGFAPCRTCTPWPMEK